jgi:hypothetical protein
MSWFRRRPPAATERVVDVLLGLHLHSPDVLVGDLPSGDRLKSIAAETLSRRGGALRLSDDAYVRAIVSSSEADLSIQMMRAGDEARGLMGEVLAERGLDARGYQYELWSEELSQDVWVQWAVAVRQ